MHSMVMEVTVYLAYLEIRLAGNSARHSTTSRHYAGTQEGSSSRVTNTLNCSALTS